MLQNKNLILKKQLLNIPFDAQLLPISVEVSGIRVRPVSEKIPRSCNHVERAAVLPHLKPISIWLRKKGVQSFEQPVHGACLTDICVAGSVFASAAANSAVRAL
jgi:hypothetical protein